MRNGKLVRLLAGAAIYSGAALAQSPLSFRGVAVQADTGILQVLSGDLNGDSNADLVFLTTQNITVLLGNGDGTFQPAMRTPAAGYDSIVLGDFNNDGKLDVVALNPAAFIDTYLGRGDGTFGSPIRSSAKGFLGASLETADFNTDGNLDLVVGGTIAFGAGDGTFARLAGGLGCPGTDQAIVDFNGDGKPDLAAVNAQEGYAGALFYQASGNGYICLGKGNGTFTGDEIYGTGIFSSTHPLSGGLSVVTGDFNGDGASDALFISTVGSQPVSYAVFFGVGDGTFKGGFGGGNLLFAQTVVADMNGDGKSDLVQCAVDSTGIFLSTGTSFRQPEYISISQPVVSCAVADFNNDGLPDIVFTGASQSAVLLNTTPRVNAVVNAASFDATEPVAPGSLVAIFGAGFGPANGTLVAFNGVPAPLLFVSARQINAQVPWSTSGTASVAVATNESSAAAFQVQTAPISPGIFTASADQALAFNLDGTLAAPVGAIAGIPSHPASVGDTLIVYANGLGPVTPPIADGVAPGDAGRLTAPTPVFIGGVSCAVTYAGLSPQFVGVNQLNVIVPAVSPGTQSLVINAGGFITSSKVTIAVK